MQIVTLHTYAKGCIRVALKRGKENALSRYSLKRIGVPHDRINRDIIQELRFDGVPIISLSSAKGYWLAEKVSEVDNYIFENRKRAAELNQLATIMENWKEEHIHELEDDVNGSNCHK